MTKANSWGRRGEEKMWEKKQKIQQTKGVGDTLPSDGGHILHVRLKTDRAGRDRVMGSFRLAQNTQGFA